MSSLWSAGASSRFSYVHRISKPDHLQPLRRYRHTYPVENVCAPTFLESHSASEVRP